MTLWMDPLSIESYDFLIKFNIYRKHLADKFKLVPIFRFENLSESVENGTQNVSYVKRHCYNKGDYCHSGIFMGKSLGNSGPYDVMGVAIIQICIRKTNEDSFYSFAKLYKKYCISKLADKMNIRLCTLAILRRKEFLNIKEKVTECVKTAIKFDFEMLNKDKSPYSGQVKLFDDQEWYYPVGSPVIIPALFIKDFRIKVPPAPHLF